MPNLPEKEIGRPDWAPVFRFPIYGENESPIKVRAARSAGREYAACLRDARSQGMGDASFDEDADVIEKHLDYLDDQYPV